MVLKKALTFEQQIDRMKNTHNLEIPNNEDAVKILSKVNYYRLSGYGIGLKQKEDKEKYLAGISLEHLYQLYCFDSLLRNKLIHVIEQIEIQLRAQISNFLGLKYGSEGYTDPANFISKISKDGSSVHSNIMTNFHRECEHQANVPFVKHHMDKYCGHFPVWVAVELFTFGNLSSLYSIMTLDDRKQIAGLYHTEPKYLGSWILALVEIRNICAHYGRLYNMPLKQSPHLYREYQKYRKDSNNKLFPALLCIKRMLAGNDVWLAFNRDLENLIDEYSNVIKFAFMGFPQDWRQVLSS